MKLEIKIDFFFFFALFWFQRKNLQRRRRERTRRQKQKQKKRRRQRRMRRSCQRRKTQLLLRFLVSISFVTSCLVQFVLRFALNQVLQLVDTEPGTEKLRFKLGCRERISRGYLCLKREARGGGEGGV
ncbi:unnamed protein product [Brassica rapa]|uniref:Uncharacterized protein n=1 Tax=Brassica campestris TaxID=3711 RepID=A0A8D9H9K1_BRACM|nr:unnamed protein product [Brassica rapa]